VARPVQQIRVPIQRETGKTLPAGVVADKYIAKISSDWKRTEGGFVTCPDQNDEFVVVLP